MGVQTFKLRTLKCIHAFPSGDHTERFPVAAIMPTEDLYAPSPKKTLEARLKHGQAREKSSKLAEQSAILLAMAQAQADVLYLDRFKTDQRNDSRLQTLQVRWIS